MAIRKRGWALAMPLMALATFAVDSPARAEVPRESASQAVDAMIYGPPSLDSAPVPVVPPPPAALEATLLLNVDLAMQHVTVRENGVVVYTWPISSGTKRYRTRTGTFTPTYATRMHYSRQWGWAPMPYAVFFDRGIAFHGTYAVRQLGRPASHGCIRLAPANAKILFKIVHAHGLKRTRVTVQGEPSFKSAPVASTRTPPRRRVVRSDDFDGWDAPQQRKPRRRQRYVEQPYKSPLGSLWD